jgi:hypothetical protein
MGRPSLPGEKGLNGILINLLLSPPKPDFASKRPGAQKYPTPSGGLLSKRSEVARSCWRATERPLYEKGESKEEEKKKHPLAGFLAISAIGSSVRTQGRTKTCSKDN